MKIHIAECDNLLSFEEELPPGERMQVVAEIWRSMDEDERLQYDNWGCLNSLRAQMGLRPLKDGVNDGEDDTQSNDEDSVIASAATMKHCTKWANTAIEQVISQSHPSNSSHLPTLSDQHR